MHPDALCTLVLQKFQALFLSKIGYDFKSVVMFFKQHIYKNTYKKSVKVYIITFTNANRFFFVKFLPLQVQFNPLIIQSSHEDFL